MGSGLPADSTSIGADVFVVLSDSEEPAPSAAFRAGSESYEGTRPGSERCVLTPDATSPTGPRRFTSFSMTIPPRAPANPITVG